MDFTDEIFLIPAEGKNLEYKKCEHGLPNSLWRTYSSFANTDGGKIILGVDEISDKKYKITGIKNPNNIKKDLWNSLHNSTTVSVNLLTNDDVETKEFFGKQIIIINVPQAGFEQRPVYIKNNRSNTFIRTDDGDRKTTDQEFKYLVVDSQHDIDTELLNNYDINDLNMEDVDAYKKLFAENTGNTSILEQGNYKFLCDIGVFRRDRQADSKEFKLTVGGLLFFGKYNSITDRFKKFQLDYFKKQSSLDSDWEDRVSSGDMNFPEMNVYSFYNITLKKLIESIPDKYLQEESLTRGSYYSDLSIAIKEALVNSLMHAYYDADYPIKISNYPKYVDFFNPGEMRVSKEEFIRGSNSVTRNSIIALLFRRVGIAEKAASGGPRIFESVNKNRLRIPEINNQFDSTNIRFWKIDMLESLDGLDKMESKIVEFAMNHAEFKFSELKKKNPQVSEHALRKSLNNILDQNIIYRIGKGPATRYRLNLTQETGIYSMIQAIKSIEDNLNR